jgi:hypothetical protein
MRAVQGHQLALEGQPSRCPFLMRNGNGRQDARSCFASRRVILLHRCRLDFRLSFLGFVFLALGVVATLGMAWEQSR